MKKYKKKDYLYTPLFCEENIWHLAKVLQAQGVKVEDMDVIFITNEYQQFAIFNQLQAPEHQPVIWDYHVILQMHNEQGNVIFDFDSRLDFPCVTQDYCENSFSANIWPTYLAKFRIIPALNYLEYFSSDRSHMLDQISQSQFPSYPPIISKHQKALLLKHLFDSERFIENTLIIDKLKYLNV